MSDILLAKPEFLEKVTSLLIRFMDNEKVYQQMLGWKKTEAFVEAEKLFKEINSNESQP